MLGLKTIKLSALSARESVVTAEIGHVELESVSLGRLEGAAFARIDDNQRHVD